MFSSLAFEWRSRRVWCVCVPAASERVDENKRGSDSWKFRFLPAGLPSCVQNSFDLPATDDRGIRGFIASLISVVSLTIWIPESGMASVLRLDRALEPPNPDMSDMPGRKHLSTRLIKSNSTIPSKTTLQPSACYPEPSAVPRACKSCCLPRGRIETLSPTTTYTHPASGPDTGGRNGGGWWQSRTMHASTISKCRVSTRMPPTASRVSRSKSCAGPRFEESRRLQSSRGRHDETATHTTRPHIVTHTYPGTHSTGFPNAFTESHLAKAEAKRGG